jgi:hypothetical protein
MAWYKTGTITVTNGSPTVTGASTLWTDVGILNAGDVLYAPDGKLYEILSINSNTGLTLTSNYLGSNASAQAYNILPIGLLPSSLAQQVKSTLTTANSALASTVRYDINSMGLSLTQQQNARTNIAALSAFDVGYGRLSKSVAGGVDVTLTAAEAANQLIELTGTLTANINVIVPAAARLFWVYNGTSGAYTVTIKTPSGTGVTVQQTGRAMLQCDATSVLYATNYLRSAGVVEDVSGNLLVGTTTAGAGLGYNTRIAVDGAGSEASVFKTSGGSLSYCSRMWNSATSGNNAFVDFQTEAGGTDRGSITYNRTGGLVAYNVTSDYRAKDILGPVVDSGALIDSVPVYTGKMKDATQERPMFIAHEVPAYAHTGEKDAVDADGNPVYQQMDASALIPVMWAELQSLRARVAQLESKP